MSELEYKQNPESSDSQENPEEEQELSFSDKIVGIFTEPAITYQKIANFRPKVVDWLVPILLMFIVVSISNILVMRNPEIKYQVKQQSMEKVNKDLTEQVQAKKITPEQADQQREMVEKQFSMMDSPIGMVISFVSTVIIGLIVVLIIVGYFYLVTKFVLKGEGTYTHALVANGMTAYIGIISIILAAILSLFFGRHMMDISVASLMNTEKGTLVYYILSKLDVFTIWAYIVLSIGLAKMFKSVDLKKYYILVFGSWIGWSLVFFILSQFVPFFKRFGM